MFWMKHFRRYVVVPAFALSFLAGVSAANAQQGPILVLTGNGYQPYASKELAKGGLASLIVSAVFAEMGFKADPVFADWQAAYKAVHHGRYLATFPWVHTEEREEDVIFSAEIFSSRPHIFQHGGVPRILSLEAMEGKTLCTVKGWAVDATLAPAVEAGKVRNVFGPSLAACFKALYQRKVDLVAAEHRLGAAVAAKIDDSKWYKNKRFAKKGTPHYVLFTRQHPRAHKWVKSFNKALNKLRKNGSLAALVKAYYAQQ